MPLSWPVRNHERRRISCNSHAMKLNAYRASGPIDD
jgi:hypothetical protein